MTIVLALVVRDEADILDANLRFHLAAGVDFVVAIDHRSTDRTPEILDGYQRAGVLEAFRRDERFIAQGEWQTRMARLAYEKYAADWVILGDADEFWWPHGRSLKEALDRVPPEYGSVRGLHRNFVPLRGELASFEEGMVVRLSATAPINDPSSPFRPQAKVAFRGSRRASVGRGGGHAILGVDGALLESWRPLEILHVPLRSREQCIRKYSNTAEGWRRNLRGDLIRARQMSGEDRPDAIWERLALDPTAVERGLAEGSLVIDERVRDALQALRDGRSLGDLLATPSPDDLDAAVFVEAQLVRWQRRLDALSARVDALERRA